MQTRSLQSTARSLRPALAVALGFLLLGGACQKPNLQGPVVSSPELVTATPNAVERADIPPNELAKPATPGLSQEVMRLGVIADITDNNAVTAGSEAAWFAMKAWAGSVNERGGLGGRNVEVVLFDSNVFSHADAVSRACESDIFALVGSYALQDGNGVDLLNAESCRLPDFPAAALNPDRRESAVTFVSNPTSNSIANAGPAQHLSELFAESASAVATVVVDMPVAFYQAQREIEAGTSAGYNYLYRATADAVDQDYDELAQELQRIGARAITWTADGERMLQLLEAWERLSSAAQAEDVVDNLETDLATAEFFFHCGANCYSQKWAEQVGELGQNVWVAINLLPFEEAGDNVELVRYVLSLREQVDADAELNLVGLSSWASALLFEEAVNRARFLSGGGLTRELVIEAARTITEWDGQGLHGLTNPAEGLPSPCFMLVTPTTSGWIRRYPATVGTMDCETDNLVELAASATLGLSSTE